jgi:hypothetical protein
LLDLPAYASDEDPDDWYAARAVPTPSIHARRWGKPVQVRR